MLLRIIEYLLGRLLYRRRGYDIDCFFNSKAFKNHNKPTIPIRSTDLSASGARLTDEYSAFGSGRIPSFTWPAAGPNVKEYLFLAEDPDAPLGHSNVHGIYCCIPPTTTSLSPSDLEVLKEEDGVKIIKSGWRVGKNRRNVVYIPSRPPRGHGPHRYFFQLIALSEKLDMQKVSKVPTKTELMEAIDGRVVEWGRWDATYESQF